MMKTVLILGGYGNFGKRISESLSCIPEITLLVSGRNIKKANQLVEKLRSNALADLKALALDIYDKDFASKLKKLPVDIVVHTCGPFQGQDYSVALACINAGAHYIDLADGREFVCGIGSLDQLAKEKNLLVISGASSVPGLSSTVIDHFQDRFATIDSIDIVIAPGNQAERGEATVRAILSYTGHPFEVFTDGQWKNVFGWMDAEVVDLGGIVGKRWLANVDVPDLALFPGRYKVKKRIGFKAGLELSFLHLSMVCMAYISKIGIVKNWAALTKLIVKMSNLFIHLGTNKGGMQVLIEGSDRDGKQQLAKWNLYADNGIGPYIPTISTIILVKKLIAGEIKQIGALPCLGLYGLDEFDRYIEDLEIETVITIKQVKTSG
jgi:saccharopine dehydrogenase-like NADP-dependent oxidoreductase